MEFPDRIRFMAAEVTMWLGNGSFGTLLKTDGPFRLFEAMFGQTIIIAAVAELLGGVFTGLFVLVAYLVLAHYLRRRQ